MTFVSAQLKLDVTIPAEGGIELGAWLFLPEGDGIRPAITMAHGFGGTREHGLERFAQAFAAAGFVVLVHGVPTLAITYFFKPLFEIIRGDAGTARRGAEIAVKLSQENGLTLFAALGTLQSAWVSARLLERLRTTCDPIQTFESRVILATQLAWSSARYQWHRIGVGAAFEVTST